jgi:plastocyanin
MLRLTLPKSAAIFLIAAALTFAAACGSDSKNTSSDTGPTAAGDQNDAPPSNVHVDGVPDGAPLISQDNLKFSPNKLTVKSGGIVYFHNAETALHTVTINGKNESGNMKKDDVYQWTAGAAGEYKITCDIHPQMKATVTVQ